MDDPEMHELVEMEINDLLEKYGYDPEETIYVKGSALAALNGENPEIGENSIKELVKVMDENIQLPERPVDKPFMLSIEGCYNIEGRGLVVTGTIDQGIIKNGEEVEISGLGKNHVTTITGIETFRK